MDDRYWWVVLMVGGEEVAVVPTVAVAMAGW